MGYKRQRGDNVWQLQIYKGINLDTGLKDYYYETFHGTARQADKRMAEIEIDMARKEFVEATNKTFYDFLINDYLSHILNNKSQNTYRLYRSTINCHIKTDSIARLRLSDITAWHVEEYKKRKINGERFDGRAGKLSMKTVKNIIILIKASIAYAHRLGLIRNNTVANIALPKAIPYQAKVLNEDQALKFVHAVQGHTYQLVYLLGLFCGLRLGEIRGTTWDAVDCARRKISITNSLSGQGRKATLGTPKTPGSKGAVTFHESFIPLFELQRKSQIRDREKCLKVGIPYDNPYNLVFTTYTGTPLRSRTIGDNLKTILRQAGLPIIRFHDLRHSCATLLINQGIPLKIIQDRLRHSSVSVTGDIYAHVLESAQTVADETMGNLLNLQKERQKNVKRLNK